MHFSGMVRYATLNRSHFSINFQPNVSAECCCFVKVGWWQPSPEAASNINLMTMHLVAVGAKLIQAVRIAETVWRSNQLAAFHTCRVNNLLI